MYWEESGSPSGWPVLYLHGGPGGACSPAIRQIFDPARYRLICFDQRGCGQSRPSGELLLNDLHSLLLDIEALRSTLGISHWLLCGSSWGATLACEYAKRHPAMVDGVMLYGAFLGRMPDIERFMIGGRQYLPRGWHEFASRGGGGDVRSMLDSYWATLERPSAQADAAALTWARYEIALSQFPVPVTGPIAVSLSAARALAKISVHFFRHGCFLPEEGVLPGLDALGDVPVQIVHGFQDAVCDIDAARTLARRWPNSRLRIVDNAGHVPRSPDHWATLSGAMNELLESTQWQKARTV